MMLDQASVIIGVTNRIGKIKVQDFQDYVKNANMHWLYNHPSFLRGVKFNFDELQPNFLWVIIDPYRPQKRCETNVSRREIFRFFSSEIRTAYPWLPCRSSYH